jgi:hypothetical protein
MPYKKREGGIPEEVFEAFGTEGLFEAGVNANLDYGKIVFFKIIECSRAESIAFQEGIQQFVSSVASLYTLLFPYIDDDQAFQNALQEELKSLKEETSTLDMDELAEQMKAEQHTFAYAQTKFRLLMKAIHKHGFLPSKSKGQVKR